jgi:hypothetical protein
MSPDIFRRNKSFCDGQHRREKKTEEALGSRNESVESSSMHHVGFLAWLTVQPGLHGVISQKTEIFITTLMRN